MSGGVGLRRGWAGVGAFVLGVFLLLGLGDGASAQGPRFTARYGTIGLETTYYAPFIVAHKKGFFEAEGVRTEAIKLSDPDLVRAVAGGALEIGIPEVGSGITASARGASIVVVGGVLDRYPYDLMVKPTIKTFADFKGKTLAHWQISPSVALYLVKKLFAENGLKDGDYQIIAGGTGSARYAALARGAIDGAVLPTPFNFLAKKGGFNAMGALNDIPALFAGIIANKAWVEKNEEALLAWMRAVIRGFRFTTNPANREEIIRLIAEEIKVDRATVEESFAQLYEKEKYLVSWDMLPSDKSMQGVMDILLQIGQVPQASASPANFFDLKYVRKARQQVDERR